MKPNCKLDDIFELTAPGIETCRVTGLEICQAAGLRENEAMLYMQLTRFGFTGVRAENLSCKKNGRKHLQTPPVICEKCGNDMSVDKRTGGCVSNYCPWCGTRKPKTI